MQKNGMRKKKFKVIRYLAAKKILKWLPDKKYIEMLYEAFLGKKIDLKNPKTFNEKLQWMKLNNKNEIYTKLVDKYEVREYIEKKIGDKYLVPLIGMYDSFDEINFDTLPKEFVLKTTHDSGGVFICRNKKNFNKNEAKKSISRSLRNNYFYWGREWPYKEVKPKIICEELIKTEGERAPIDYKFHCFDGVVDSVMVCIGRGTENKKFYFLDNEWNLLKYNLSGMNAPKNLEIEKPEMMEEMFEISSCLSKGFSFVRVDLYCENGKVYFGELTFFPESGFDSNLIESADILLGEKLNLK